MKGRSLANQFTWPLVHGVTDLQHLRRRGAEFAAYSRALLQHGQGLALSADGQGGHRLSLAQR